MKPWEFGNLEVAQNGRYLKNGDEPFFWLGDTAWQLLAKCSLEETQQYLHNRAELNFNVIQTVLVHELDKDEGNGRPPEKSHMRAEYWQHVKKVVEMAQELGLYMGLLPAWGKLLRTGTLNAANAKTYADFLGNYFQAYPNIIWIMGGDLRGDVAPDVVRTIATTLKTYNPSRLMTYHPFGRTSSSLWFAQDAWLDMNLFQSGHRRYDQVQLNQWDDNLKKEDCFGEDSWRYVKRDYKTVEKPTLDGEPSYEGIRQGLHIAGEPYWEVADVRRYAYWAVFEGAAGHTYGSNAMMQFYAGDGEGAYGVRETWQQALHAEGAGQMQHLYRLMYAVDFTQGVAAPQLVTAGQGERYHRISVFAGKAFVYCYAYDAKHFTLDLTAYKHTTMELRWFNPQSGIYSYFGTVSGQDALYVTVPKRYETVNDWVLVLKETKK